MKEYYRLLVITHIREEKRLILGILNGILMIMCFRSKFLQLTQALSWITADPSFRCCMMYTVKKDDFIYNKNEPFIDRK